LDKAIVEEHYNQRCLQFAVERDRMTGRWNQVANLRLWLAVGALAAGGIGWYYSFPLLFWLAGALALSFFAAVVWHYRLGLQRDRFAELFNFNAEGLARLKRDWAGLPLRRPPDSRTNDSIAVDLDLLGHASLQHVLNTPTTVIGQEILENWLLKPAPPDEITRRQAAIGELAPLFSLREELAVQGRLANLEQHRYQQFLAWAEAEPWLKARPALLWATRILPILLISGILAQIFGFLALPLWLPLLLINIGLIVTVGRPAEAISQQLTASQSVFKTYANLFALIGRQSFQSAALKELQARLTSDADSATQRMAALSRLMALADLRMSLLYPALQLFLLWNFHVLWLLERWQSKNGAAARQWIEALGEFEALAGLAALAHAHPDWRFPTLTPEEPAHLVARQLAHPLLRPAVAVANDVSIGPPGSFLLVTGSNMSGKSTLLRAIGLNVALAQAGGPVCAGELRLPPLQLATSMRVSDSLELGVSYFMAELQRLKDIVDAADQARDGPRTLLFLLDEILHGTNTAERQIAARRIIRHLLAQGAIGAVSTHDLGLAEADDLAGAGQMVHFGERLDGNRGGPQLQFDYTLRPGLAGSTNALKLMALIGLPQADE